MHPNQQKCIHGGSIDFDNIDICDGNDFIRITVAVLKKTLLLTISVISF